MVARGASIERPEPGYAARYARRLFVGAGWSCALPRCVICLKSPCWAASTKFTPLSAAQLELARLATTQATLSAVAPSTGRRWWRWFLPLYFAGFQAMRKRWRRYGRLSSRRRRHCLSSGRESTNLRGSFATRWTLCWRSKVSTDRPSGALDAADGSRSFPRHLHLRQMCLREPTVR